MNKLLPELIISRCLKYLCGKVLFNQIRNYKKHLSLHKHGYHSSSLYTCAPIAAMCTGESHTWLLHVICKPAESRIGETFSGKKK